MIPPDDDPGSGAQAGPDEVEALPLPERAEAYLAVERALRERLGLGGP